MLALWWLLIPGLTALTGRFPGAWIGTANLPANIARSWARWGRSRHYVCDARGEPFRPHNEQITFPIRWLSFTDDPIAPYEAVEALRPYYPGAPGRAPASRAGRSRRRGGRPFRLLPQVDAARRLGRARIVARRAVARIAGARADWAGEPARGTSRMSAPHVLAEVKDGIGWLTLNRPESLNALSFEMTDLLIKHTAEFEKDAKVRCVVIRGAGTHFMAGGDIKGFHKSLTENKASPSRRLRDARGEGAPDDLPDPPHAEAGAGLGAGRRRGLRPVADPELRPRDRRRTTPSSPWPTAISACRPTAAPPISCRASWASAKPWKSPF